MNGWGIGAWWKRNLISIVVAGITLAFLLVHQFDMTHCSEGVGKQLWLMGTDTVGKVCVELPAKHFELLAFWRNS